MDIAGLFGAPLSRLDDTVHISPLLHQTGIAGRCLLVSPDDVVRNHIHAECRDHVRELVLDEWIGMVRTTSQENGQLTVLATLCQDILAALLHLRSILTFSLQCSGQRSLSNVLVDTVLLEEGQDLLAQQRLITEIDHGRLYTMLQRHGTADHVGVCCDYRAVITVDRAVIVLMLKDHIRHEDESRPVLRQLAEPFVEFLNMRVGEFRRKTDIVAHHRAQRTLVFLECRLRAEHHLKTSAREERMPERKLLIHIQHTRNGDDLCARRHRGLFGTAEEQPVFLAIDILSFVVVLSLVVEDPLTFVAGVVASSTTKAVHCYKALVLTALAVEQTCLARRLPEQIVERDMMQLCRGLTSGNGVQGTTIGTHHLRDVAASHPCMREQLKSTDDRIVLHCTALYDDMLPEVIVTSEFQYLIEAVAHHRIGQSGCNVSHRSAFAQHLLHLGIHKHRTARAEVTGTVGLTSQGGKVLHAVAQTLRKGLDKRSTTRGAGLVEFHTHHSAMIDKDRFHVLTADVEDKRHVGQQACGSPLMGHRLDDAVIEVKGSLDQLLAIARRARAHDVECGSAFLSLELQTFESFLYGMDRIAEIHAVVAENDLPLVALVCTHHDELCRCGARVDTDDHLFASAMHGIERGGITLFVVEPRCIFSLRAEERLQPVGRNG